MSNGNTDEWNRWRGEQTAVLRIMTNELENIGGRLGKIERSHYIMQGKATAYGALSGALVAIIIAIVRSAI